MSDLLTRTEYQAIADTLVFPRAAFIDGKFRAGRGDSLTTINQQPVTCSPRSLPATAKTSTSPCRPAKPSIRATGRAAVAQGRSRAQASLLTRNRRGWRARDKRQAGRRL